jgi:LysM repeat protein
MAANEAPLPRREEVKPAPAGSMKIVGKEEPTKVAKALPVEPDSGKFYIVAKGDNTVSIAKKLKVSQGELLSANNITDTTKLQIGQKLRVPEKTTTAKASPKSKATDR